MTANGRVRDVAVAAKNAHPWVVSFFMAIVFAAGLLITGAVWKTLADEHITQNSKAVEKLEGEHITFRGIVTTLGSNQRLLEQRVELNDTQYRRDQRAIIKALDKLGEKIDMMAPLIRED